MLKLFFRVSIIVVIFFVVVIGFLLIVICMMFFCMNCEKMCNCFYKKGYVLGSIYKVYVYYCLFYNVCYEDFFFKLKVFWFYYYLFMCEFIEKYSFKDDCIMDGLLDYFISLSY